MIIEKEFRYKINEYNIPMIREISSLKEERQEQLDILMGYYGFESLEKLGYICRIRKKHNKISLECKKRTGDSQFTEESIGISSLKQGYNFFASMGLKPYLYIHRYREERSTEDFRLYIDNVDLLGTFLEIEIINIYDKNIYLKLKNFLKEIGVENIPQKLYGDLFQDKILNCPNIKEQMLKNIQTLVK